MIVCVWIYVEVNVYKLGRILRRVLTSYLNKYLLRYFYMSSIVLFSHFSHFLFLNALTEHVVYINSLTSVKHFAQMPLFNLKIK